VSVEVYLTPSLQYVISDVKSITVEGQTLGECLNNMVAMYPELSGLLFGPGKKIRNDYVLFIDGESAPPDDLDRPVKAGGRLHIVDVIIGG
jgi:hypothetical protein